MKTRRLYLSLLFLLCLYWTAIGGLQIAYMTLAETFGEGGFNRAISVEVIRHFFLFGGLSVCFGWEALSAHLSIRRAKGMRIPRWMTLTGAFFGIFLGLSGFAWSAAFALCTRRTWKVLGAWSAVPDALFILLGIGGALYFLGISVRTLRAPKELS